MMKYLILISFALCLSFAAQAQSRVVTPSDVTTVVVIEKDGEAINQPLRKDGSVVTTRTAGNANTTVVVPSGVAIDTKSRDLSPRSSVDMNKTVVYEIPKRKERKRDDR